MGALCGKWKNPVAGVIDADMLAIRGRPEDDRLKLNFAEFLIAFERPESARPILDELFQRHPTDSTIAFNCFKLSIQLGNTKAARESLARIVEIFPEHPEIEAFKSAINQP